MTHIKCHSKILLCTIDGIYCHYNVVSDITLNNSLKLVGSSAGESMGCWEVNSSAKLPVSNSPLTRGTNGAGYSFAKSFSQLIDS